MAATRLGLGLVLLLLGLADVGQSSLLLHETHWGLSRASGECNGLVGDCINMDEEMMMESEFARRHLAGAGFISYGAMKRGRVPCSQRGVSYYNCGAQGRANPYRRSCNILTRCGRR